MEFTRSKSNRDRMYSPSTTLTPAVDNARRLLLLEGQNVVLELIARNAGLVVVLERLVRSVERIFADAQCCVVLLEESGEKIARIVGPSVAEGFLSQWAALPFTMETTPCAAAARRGEPVVVEDIGCETRWPAFRNLALASGLHSLWTQPILNVDGKAVATVVFLHRRPRTPSWDDIYFVDSLCPLAQLAIEHGRRADALEKANERFTSLAANVPGVVYQRVVSPDENIRYTYISEGARDLFGVAPEEVLANSQALFDRHGPEFGPTFRERLLKASRELTMWDVEAPIITPNGEHKWTHAIARPRRQPDGSVVWNGIILDATRIKEASLELAASNRAKSEFLANMSHELRTPLNAIIGFSELMATETLGRHGNPKYKNYAEDILESGRHLLSIINDILDLAKIESGRMELLDSEIDPHNAIEGAIRLVEKGANSHGLQIDREIPEDIPHIFADEKKLKQMLINLLSNAIKFTPSGGRVTVASAVAEEGGLAISVTDTGIGIDHENIRDVLKPFVQADGSLSRKFEGTGLGLPLVNAMIESHGGHLVIESEKGVSTTATLHFPAERVLS